MEKIKAAMSREEMVQMLVLDSVEHGGDFRRYAWLQSALEHGFCGYATMSRQALLKEMGWRGLSTNVMSDDNTLDGENEAIDIASLLGDHRSAIMASE